MVTVLPDAAATSLLLAQVRRLELVARRNVATLRHGDYQTAVRGRGLLFHESRKYVPGESARTIDWNITARVGEPHVRVHEEERQRDVVLAVDVSPSMHVGYGRRSKLELAVEVAATLAVAALETGDRIGCTFFADQVLEENRPRAGRAQLFRVLRALLRHTEPWTRAVAVSDPRTAIHAVEQRARGPLVLFLVSDFIDHDLPADLRYLRPRHDVTLLHLYDPFEAAVAPELVLSGLAPEGPQVVVPFSPGETGQWDQLRRTLAQACGENRLSFASLSTDDAVGRSLGRHFHRRRRERW